MATRAILHVDMDAFYASIEQRDNPAYMNRPVIVGADPKNGTGRGVVAACSYEARTCGIRSALPIRTAWKFCPEGVYVRPRMQRYIEVSRQVMEILGRFSNLVEPVSIDEAFLDVTGSLALLGSPERIARAIKAEIREKAGLTASVGGGPNKFVAKIASDLRKPDGLLLVESSEVAAFLRDLPISRLWGVGPKTERRLTDMGFRIIGDLRNSSREDLARSLGGLGEHLFQLSHGLDERPVVADWEPKSISAETTFERDTDDPEVIRQTIQSLADRVGRRLRQDNYAARKLTLKIRYEDFETHTHQTTAKHPAQTDAEIGALAVALLKDFPLDRNRRIRLLGVGAGQLQRGAKESAQMDFFKPEPANSDALSGAVDRIREKFGDAALQRASHMDPGDPQPKGGL